MQKSKWTACGGGDCSCATIWSRDLDVPLFKAYRGKWGDEYSVVEVHVGDLLRPDNATISARMEMIEYGEIKPEFSAKMVKLATAAPELLEALKAFMDVYAADRDLATPKHVADCWDLADRALQLAALEDNQ